jgi:hypothetical protein
MWVKVGVRPRLACHALPCPGGDSLNADLIPPRAGGYRKMRCTTMGTALEFFAMPRTYCTLQLHKETFFTLIVFVLSQL